MIITMIVSANVTDIATTIFRKSSSNLTSGMEIRIVITCKVCYIHDDLTIGMTLYVI